MLDEFLIIETLLVKVICFFTTQTIMHKSIIQPVKLALHALVVFTVTNTLPDIKKSQWMQEPTVLKSMVMVAAIVVVNDNTRKELGIAIFILSS